MSTVTKPILLDETGQAIVSVLGEIKDAIDNGGTGNNPVKIIVISPPQKTNYSLMGKLDLSGIAVGAVFADNSIIDITDQCSFSPAEGATITSDGDITISWTWHPTSKTFTTSQAISVYVPTWSDGTDEEIAALLEGHYAGDINIRDYWAVGDERVVSLAAMDAIGVKESHVAQDVTLVLTEEGGKYLSDGVTECAFQWDQEDCLIELGNMNPTDTNVGGWKDSARRTWCNSVYKNALPSTLRGIFKEFINQSGVGGGATSGVEDTTDTIALRAYVELTGMGTQHLFDGEGEQVEYYKTVSNRIKQVDSTIGWWLRSPSSGSTYDAQFFRVLPDGEQITVYTAGDNIGIAPFGVI